MRPFTLLRLAVAGTRTDTLRVALTALSLTLATLATLAAATVLAIGKVASPDELAEQYGNALLREPGLRPGVAFALVMLTLPVLALAGQCGRLGAPARDRRLAAIRLAGATPRQAVMIVVAETGLASVLGAVLGLAGYLVGRHLLGHPGANGKLALPTDVLPSPWVLVAICLGLPLAATVVAVVLLRRVTVTPFGVTRTVRTGSPGPWPGILIAPGVAAFTFIQPLGRYVGRHHIQGPNWIPPALLFFSGLFAMIGVVLGTGWISHVSGRLLHRVARRPAALLAARRLIADPWSGSRTFAALLAGVMFGAGAAGIRIGFVTEFGLREEAGRWMAAATGEPYIAAENESFYFRALDLVNAAVLVGLAIAALGLLVALCEGIVSRRRTYAGLVATGVPRGTLARATLWQVLTPAVPAVLVALSVGTCLARGLATESTSGGMSASICEATAEQCADPAISSQYLRTIEPPRVVREIPIPFHDLALLGAGTLVVILAVIGLSLLFLRSSTAVEELRTT